MRFSRPVLIFCYGLFSIAAQALLFREFITTFEGNDIAVGIFFGSWFLWVGTGAVLAYRYGPDYPGLKGKDLKGGKKLAPKCPDMFKIYK